MRWEDEGKKEQTRGWTVYSSKDRRMQREPFFEVLSDFYNAAIHEAAALCKDPKPRALIMIMRSACR